MPGLLILAFNGAGAVAVVTAALKHPATPASPASPTVTPILITPTSAVPGLTRPPPLTAALIPAGRYRQKHQPRCPAILARPR